MRNASRGCHGGRAHTNGYLIILLQRSVPRLRHVPPEAGRLAVLSRSPIPVHRLPQPSENDVHKLHGGVLLIAGRFGRTRRATRFSSASAFASYGGVAPVEVASADHDTAPSAPRRYRQLNLALHIAALTQVRMRAGTGWLLHTEIAVRKIHNEAMRCLKRRLAITSGAS